MVQLKGPLFSLKASKQLGKSLIYKTTRNRSFLTKYNKPGGNTAFDASPTQLNQRMLYNLIIARWQTMTDNERQVYIDEAKAKNLKMSDWNLFYKQAIKDLPAYLGLQGYWSFNRIVNGKILDLSGNGNDGTLNPSYPANAPQLADSINKKFGKAGVFDGIDDYVDCGNDASLDITDAITIEAWMKTNILSGTQGVAIVTKLTPDSYDGYAFRIEPTGDLKYYRKVWVIGNIDVMDKQWHHVAVVDYGDGTCQFYVDGSKDGGLKSGLTYVGALTQDLWIGRETWNPTEYLLNGTIDEVRIYNRALDADEIKKHYELISKK